MATTSEVITGLDAIAAKIAESAALRANGKAQLLRSQQVLYGIPTTHAAVITTIDAYVPTGSFETLKKDEKAKLATEFVAQKSAIEAELTALNVSFTP